jgi:ABC-2 type transport system permease protein
MRPRSFSIALGVARRSTRKLLKNPLPGLPPLMISLFMFAAFTGALSALANTKGFDYYNFTAFEFVFVLYMAAMFVGAFSAFEIAADYESGLAQRFMLAAPQRLAIIVGYLIAGLARLVVALVVVFGIALAAGMPVKGGPVQVAEFVALATLLSFATTLYGAGVALRLQSITAGTLILIPTFMFLFTTPVFVQRDQLSGWVKTAAGVNPLTPAIEAGRSLLADQTKHVGLAFAIVGGLVILFTMWAVRGMAKAERGPGGGRKRGPGRRPGAADAADAEPGGGPARGPRRRRG